MNKFSDEEKKVLSEFISRAYLLMPGKTIQAQQNFLVRIQGDKLTKRDLTTLTNMADTVVKMTGVMSDFGGEVYGEETAAEAGSLNALTLKTRKVLSGHGFGNSMEE